MRRPPRRPAAVDLANGRDSSPHDQQDCLELRENIKLKKALISFCWTIHITRSEPRDRLYEIADEVVCEAKELISKTGTRQRKCTSIMDGLSNHSYGSAVLKLTSCALPSRASTIACSEPSSLGGSSDTENFVSRVSSTRDEGNNILSSN